jgi:hypothetical protein
MLCIFTIDLKMIEKYFLTDSSYEGFTLLLLGSSSNKSTVYQFKDFTKIQFLFDRKPIKNKILLEKQ